MVPIKKQAKKSSTKPTKQKPAKPRKPTQKQVKHAQGLLAGKSNRDAARQAGYKPNTYNHADRLMPALKLNFQELVRREIPPELVVKRLREGLDATTTKVATFEGEITDEAEYVDHGERRAHLELAAELGGYAEKKGLEGIEITIRSVLNEAKK